MNENNEKQLYEYEKGWGDMMVDMWREQLRLLNAIDTGALYASFSATVTDGDTTTIEHQFAEYGIAVAQAMDTSVAMVAICLFWIRHTVMSIASMCQGRWDRHGEAG